MECQTSESALVDAAVAGDRLATGRLLLSHAPALSRFIAARLPADVATVVSAEDVLQDVFVALPRALRSYREQGRFGAWLKRLTARTVLMRMRAVRRRAEVDLDAVEVVAADAPADRPVEWAALEKARGKRPTNLRLVFVLKELEGYSHAEVAELLDIKEGAAMTRLSRAWQFLRKELAP